MEITIFCMRRFFKLHSDDMNSDRASRPYIAGAGASQHQQQFAGQEPRNRFQHTFGETWDIAVSPPFGIPAATGARPQRQNPPYGSTYPIQPQQPMVNPRVDQRYGYNQRVFDPGPRYIVAQSDHTNLPPLSHGPRDIGRSHRKSGDLSASYTGFGANAADLDIPFPQHQQRSSAGLPPTPTGLGVPGPYGTTYVPSTPSYGASGTKLPPGLEPPSMGSYGPGTWPSNTGQPAPVPRQRPFGAAQQPDQLALEWPGNEKLDSPRFTGSPDMGGTNAPVTSHGKKEGKSRTNINLTGSPPKTNPYNNHRKARKTGEVDDLYYYLDYDKRASPQSDPNRNIPELETTLEADEQDKIFQKLNDLLSLGMFNFFARHQFPLPIDPGKRRVRKPSDREWHEWLELAIALCEKRMIPKTLLHNERIKEFVTILQNSGEIRHVVAHPSRPLKSDMGVFQLISAGIHVAQIIRDWDGMEELLKVKESTENIIAKRRRRRESIKKHVRFLEQYAESEGLD